MFSIKQLVKKMLNKVIEPVKSKLENYFMTSYTFLQVDDDYNYNPLNTLIYYDQKTKDKIPGIDIINSREITENCNKLLDKEQNGGRIQIANKCDVDKEEEQIKNTNDNENDIEMKKGSTEFVNDDLIDLYSNDKLEITNVTDDVLQNQQTIQKNNYDRYNFSNLSVWNEESFEEDCNNCLSDYEMKMSFALENKESLDYCILKQTLKDQNKLIDNLYIKIEQLERKQKVCQNRIISLEQELLINTERMQTFKDIASEKIKNLEAENERLRLLYDSERMSNLFNAEIIENLRLDLSNLSLKTHNKHII